MIWLLRRLFRGSYYIEARDAVANVVLSLRLPPIGRTVRFSEGWPLPGLFETAAAVKRRAPTHVECGAVPPLSFFLSVVPFAHPAPLSQNQKKKAAEQRRTPRLPTSAFVS